MQRTLVLHFKIILLKIYLLKNLSTETLLFRAKHSGWFTSQPVKEHDPIFMADLQMHRGLSAQSNKGIHIGVTNLATTFVENLCEISRARADFSVLNVVKSGMFFLLK
jgi:hypothetical protein